jgi:hypothetical protein
MILIENLVSIKDARVDIVILGVIYKLHVAIVSETLDGGIQTRSYG